MIGALLALVAVLMARFDVVRNQFVEGESVSLATGAKTATGNTGWLDSTEFEAAVLELDVTAASGTTPTLDVTIETAEDAAGTNGRSLGAFAQKTAAGNERKSFDGFDRFYRAVWTVGGTTPSFTFTLTGETK